MKVLTLNTWSENGPWQARWELVFQGILGHEPDVVSFQEIFNPAWIDEIRKRLSDCYRIFSFEEPSGLVCLFRLPVLSCEIQRLKPESPTEQCPRYAIFAKIQTGIGPVFIANTHLSWRPNEAGVREGQIRELLNILDAKAVSEPVFAMGDFNADALTREISVMLNEGQFVDMYAWKNPRDKGHTWCHENPYTRAEHNILSEELLGERRIDYIFLKDTQQNLLTKLESVKVVFTRPNRNGVWASDHFGVFATLAQL